MDSDADLLLAWRGGDPQSGATLFKRYFEAINRFFINKVPHDPDDLIQETFMACLRGKDRVRQEGSFRSYLFAIACNTLRVYYRRRKHLPLESQIDHHSAHQLAPGPSTVMRAREEERLLLEALRRIPLELQMVLELHYWEAMSTTEIAAVLEIPVGTARGRLQRGRGHLLEKLTQLPAPDATRTRLTDDLDSWAGKLRHTVSPRDG